MADELPLPPGPVPDAADQPATFDPLAPFEPKVAGPQVLEPSVPAPSLLDAVSAPTGNDFPDNNLLGSATPSAPATPNASPTEPDDGDGLSDLFENVTGKPLTTQDGAPDGGGNGLSALLSNVLGATPGDLVVTTSAHKYFTEHFDAYRDALVKQRDFIRGFVKLPDVVTYTSALDTNRQLNTDARERVLTTLDRYIAYLDEYKTAVDARIRKIQADL